MKLLKDEILFDTATADFIGLVYDQYGEKENSLYRTEGGIFFLHSVCSNEGMIEDIEPISVDEAKEYFERIPEPAIEFEEAFNEPLILCKDWPDPEERCDESEEH